MGSALDAAKFSIQQGFTGVSDPSSTFSAIDKGIKDLTDWQTKRKEDKEKLETDTATKYREAEKQAYENLPSGKNAQAQILSGLEEYKERLYTNMKLVQRGVIGANDNLIFRENGTQSFNILSDIVKDYDKQREEYIKGAEGYIDEKTGERVEPIYGSVAAALQDMQTQIGNPEFTNLGFDSKGNGTITFYETKINEQTSTRELVLDKNGNPIPQKGLDGVNLIAYKNGRNQTALRVNLDQRTRDLVGADSLLGKKYQTMISQGGMVGVVIDDIRGKDGKQVKSLITNAAGNLITNVAEMASVLSDNGENPSQVLNDRMWGEAKRNGADMDEKIPYDYVDLETGELKQGMKSKYIKLKTANNNQMVPILSEDDKLAAERIAQFSVYNSLERGVSGGSKVTTFDPNRSSRTTAKELETKKIGRVEFAKRMASGDTRVLEEMKASGLYTDKEDFNEILSKSGLIDLEEKDSKGNPRKGEIYQVYTSRGVQPRTVYHTNEDGSITSLQDRTQQTLSLIATNPIETQDLFNVYTGAGNNFNETYNPANFKENTVSTGPITSLSMETIVEGRGNKAITLNDVITDVIKTADEVDNLQGAFGIDEDLLVKGIEGALNQALIKSEQKIDGLAVTYDKDDITITGVNSKGKTITVTGNQSSDEPNAMKVEIDAILNEFFQNLGSDKDYNPSGAAEKKSGMGQFNSPAVKKKVNKEQPEEENKEQTEEKIEAEYESWEDKAKDKRYIEGLIKVGGEIYRWNDEINKYEMKTAKGWKIYNK